MRISDPDEDVVDLDDLDREDNATSSIGSIPDCSNSATAALALRRRRGTSTGCWKRLRPPLLIFCGSAT